MNTHILSPYICIFTHTHICKCIYTYIPTQIYISNYIRHHATSSTLITTIAIVIVVNTEKIMLLGGIYRLLGIKLYATCFNLSTTQWGWCCYLFPFSGQKWDTEVLSIISRTEFETQGPHNRAGLSGPKWHQGRGETFRASQQWAPSTHLAVQLTVLSRAWARAKSSTAVATPPSPASVACMMLGDGWKCREWWGKGECVKWEKGGLGSNGQNQHHRY